MTSQSYKLKDDEMRKLCETKPQFIDGGFLLCDVILALAIFVGLVYFIYYSLTNSFSIDFKDIALFILISAITVFVNILYLDQFVWIWFGKETISYDSKRLMIQRKRLMFRKNIIKWEDIESANIYEPPILVRTHWGPQETIIIRYGKHKKAKIGVNAPNPQELIDRILKLKRNSLKAKN